MNISLPDDMKAWVEAQTATGRYGNSSDVVRDLVRREQDRQIKIANMKRMVQEGRDSGIDPRSKDEMMADMRAKAEGMMAK
ncbi:type II toxin-antitoxin system ParD family antitoxin [Sphingomonas sp. MMS24-JH45]